jgi:hypothetical protein
MGGKRDAMTRRACRHAIRLMVTVALGPSPRAASIYAVTAARSVTSPAAILCSGVWPPRDLLGRLAWSLTRLNSVSPSEGSAWRKCSGCFPAPRRSGSRQRQLIGGYRNIGLAKIVALEQQRCRFIPRQRVGTTVAEIERGIVSSTALASKGLACDFGLTRREWNYFDVQFCE